MIELWACTKIKNTYCGLERDTERNRKYLHALGGNIVGDKCYFHRPPTKKQEREANKIGKD